jgi:hypothetical protein
MKTRKILPLVLLAVGSLFLLSSCDAMLDAIFQNNQVTVDVAVSYARAYNDWFYGTNSQVSCTIFDGSGNPTTSTGSWTSLDGFAVHYNFTFTKLKNDTYSFAALYRGYTFGPAGNDGNLYDGTYGSTTFIPLLTSPFLTMPYKNPGDSTGHSMSVKLWVP